MKNHRTLYIVIFTVVSVFACQRAVIEDPPAVAHFENIGEFEGLERGACFEFEYPVSFLMPDLSVIEIDSESSLDNLRNWYEEHPGIDERPVLQFPLSIIFPENGPVEIDHADSLRTVYLECNSGSEYCFDLVYPVTYIMPDGSLIPVAFAGETGEFDRWYAENPGVEESHILQFPVDIKYDDNTEITIHTNSEFLQAIADCL